MTEVEKLIKEIQSKYGSTQRWIAKKLEITPYHLSECKKGVRRPSQELIDKLKELAE